MKRKFVIETLPKKLTLFGVQNLISIAFFYIAFTLPCYSNLAERISSNEQSLFIFVIIINMGIPLVLSFITQSILIFFCIRFADHVTTTEGWADTLLFFISPIIIMAVAAGIPADTGDIGIFLSIPIMTLSSIVLGYKFNNVITKMNAYFVFRRSEQLFFRVNKNNKQTYELVASEKAYEPISICKFFHNGTAPTEEKFVLANLRTTELENRLHGYATLTMYKGIQKLLVCFPNKDMYLELSNSSLNDIETKQVEFPYEKYFKSKSQNHKRGYYRNFVLENRVDDLKELESIIEKKEKEYNLKINDLVI